MEDFKISSETLPDANPREVAIKELDALCRECIEVAHLMQKAESEKNERLIGRYEERIYTLVDTVHKRQRYWDQERGVYLAISHTQEGLPVRVNPSWKRRLWN